MLGEVPEHLAAYESWWETDGRYISDAVDRAGTPWLRMFDRAGSRVDEVLYPPEYWTALRKGYEAGTVWRTFEERSLVSSALLDYVACFYDPGITCPYTVTLATAIAVDKHAPPELRERFLPRLLRESWQGATWMTEIKGGSDLGANVETVARPAGGHWLVTGDKYFASNAGADLALVAARPEGAAGGVRGIALFLLPKRRENGELNYLVRRLKDKIGTRSVPTGEVELRSSEAYLLGSADRGIYLVLEVLNLSRVMNAMGSVAIAQRAMAEALAFARQRIAFGKAILDHPLLGRQFDERLQQLQGAFRLAWKAVQHLNEIWRETPPYSERYHVFRLVAHLAKYWTSEIAPQFAHWAMEVHGALGVLEEFPVERWFREAMILTIWEGTSHRHILDGLEVMERKGVHRQLFSKGVQERIDRHLALPPVEREAGAEELFRQLAMDLASQGQASSD